MSGSISAIITLGYGSFSSVNLVPTLGYGTGTTRRDNLLLLGVS